MALNQHDREMPLVAATGIGCLSLVATALVSGPIVLGILANAERERARNELTLPKEITTLEEFKAAVIRGVEKNGKIFVPAEDFKKIENQPDDASAIKQLSEMYTRVEVREGEALKGFIYSKAKK